MTYASWITTLVAIIALALVATAVVRAYRECSQYPEWQFESLWGKTLCVCRGSATWFLGYVQIVGATIIQGLAALADALHQPQISDILEKHFDPKVVGGVLLVSGLLVLWARSRTLGKPDA